MVELDIYNVVVRKRFSFILYNIVLHDSSNAKIMGSIPSKGMIKKILAHLVIGIFVEKEPKILLKLSSPILYPCVESAR